MHTVRADFHSRAHPMICHVVAGLCLPRAVCVGDISAEGAALILDRRVPCGGLETPATAGLETGAT